MRQIEQEPKSSKARKPYRARRIGIVNPYGDIWTPDTFDNAEQARAYIAEFWRRQPDTDLSKFTTETVRVTVSRIAPRKPK